ncbi:uncharacterized protein BO95DRAFT_435435 [Aspergillus brunneoviolaceus CBS 621.78]|uniref:Uncharacterized protein n=1 Tax=Aspergillus brunneoviolaceus CBS 621.78 TaxID=1450534 RepID=A0ACD1FY56_9EURO|nr:hypothetical protein BO95DRAFT_435435 [Aspergillus brunneoviolaceus CBS 621.78]RAH41851.1 hypothetical protein BO95DRAFT_435435 [Aspergillus brunneoviolaceus CBS 621.78]
MPQISDTQLGVASVGLATDRMVLISLKPETCGEDWEAVAQELTRAAWKKKREEPLAPSEPYGAKVFWGNHKVGFYYETPLDHHPEEDVPSGSGAFALASFVLPNSHVYYDQSDPDDLFHEKLFLGRLMVGQADNQIVDAQQSLWSQLLMLEEWLQEDCESFPNSILVFEA